MSSREVEYVPTTTTSFHAVWIRILLKDMEHIEKEPTSIFCDNSSAVPLGLIDCTHVGRFSHLPQSVNH